MNERAPHVDDIRSVQDIPPDWRPPPIWLAVLTGGGDSPFFDGLKRFKRQLFDGSSWKDIEDA